MQDLPCVPSLGNCTGTVFARTCLSKTPADGRVYSRLPVGPGASSGGSASASAEQGTRRGGRGTREHGRPFGTTLTRDLLSAKSPEADYTFLTFPCLLEPLPAPNT